MIARRSAVRLAGSRNPPSGVTSAAMHVGPYRIATARLTLRRPAIDDAQAVFAYASEPQDARRRARTGS